MADKLMFPIGFDLEEGVKQVQKEWDSKYQKKISKAISDKPIEVKLKINAEGFDKDLKHLREVADALKKSIKDLSTAQKAHGQALKSQEQAKQAKIKTQRDQIKLNVDEKTQEDKIARQKLQTALAEQRLANAKANGTNQTRAQNSAYRTQTNILTNIMTKMAAYASIYQAINFASKIRETTAEFELQRVALGALIQDTYKANAIFEQIKVQAVKSPFQVKELVTYTKQLAAYGTKAEDLMGTMNMLADISAGLGVDMNRIILAYGQIQAASVLKGTELRQLTEAGIPMVELLAQYYSTLRNEVVTTAEVFKMISAKEVPFEAVKDILEDLTSEGGRFYEMQAKQAQTLAGQWNNMKDALSIMFDEMGRSEDMRSLFESLIDGVKWLARNWMEVFKSVRLVVSVYGILKAATIATTLATTLFNSAVNTSSKGLERWNKTSGLVTNALNRLRAINLKSVKEFKLSSLSWKMLGNGIISATKALTAFIAKMALAVLANPVGWIMGITTAIAGFKLATSEARDEMDVFNDRMRESAKEAVANTTQMVAQFEKLANAVLGSADGSAKQQEALRKLKQQFGDMFPDYKLTVEYLREMANNATDSANAFDALKTNIQGFMAEQMRQQFVENYTNKIQEQYSQTFADLTDNIGNNWSELLGKMQAKAIEGDLETVLNEVFAAWKQKYNSKEAEYHLGFIYDAKSFDQALERANNLLNTFGGMGKAGDDLRQKTGLWDMQQILLMAKAFAESKGNIDSMMQSFDNLDPKMAAVNNALKEFDKTTQDIRKESGYYGNLYENVFGKEQARDLWIADQVEDETKALIQQLTGLDAPIANLIYDAMQAMPVDEVIRQLRYAEGAFAGVVAEGIELSNAAEYGLSKLEERMPTFYDSWRRDLDSMTGYLEDGTKKVTVYSKDQIKAFKDLPTSLTEAAKKYKEVKENAITLTRVKSSGGITDTKELAKLNEELAKSEYAAKKLYEYLAKYGALTLLDNDAKEWMRLIKNRTKLMENFQKSYEEFRKTQGEDEALASAQQAWKHQALELGVNIETLKDPSADLKKWYSDTAAVIKAQIGKLGGKEWQGLSVEAILSKNTTDGVLTALKQLLNEIHTAMGKFNTDKAVKTDEKILKDITQKLSRTKAASEFFDRMLGLTGDKELTASLTMSVYGEGGDQLGAELAKQTAEEFKEKYKDISFSKDAISEDGLFNWSKIEAEAKAHADSLGTQIDEDLRKAIDKGKQDQAKRIESFVEELEAAKTYGEKLVKLHQQTQQRIKDINETVLDETLRSDLLTKADKLYAKKVSELQYEAFKDSPMYVLMFEKLDATSGAMLRNMRQYMTDLQDSWKNLDPTQLKELQSRLNKIDEQLASRNPFESIISGLKEYHELSKDGNSRAQDEMVLFNATKARMEAEKEYQEAVQSKASIEVLNKRKEKLDGCVDAEKSAAKQMQQWDNAIQKAVSGINNLSKVFDVIKAVTKAINDMSAALGGFGDTADAEFWSTILGGVDKFLEGTMSAATGVGQILAGDIFGGVTSMISGISNLATSLVDWIYADRIKNANKEIEYQADILDNLSYAYERLEKAQEKAFGSEYIDVYHQKLANLQAQYEAYRKQLEAEQSKGKKADDAKINEYEDSMKKTVDAIKDMQTQLSEHLLGTDLASAARDFANAWVEAYKEFGSTTDAMKEKFQDMIQNMIVESMAAEMMKQVLGDVFSSIDSFTKDGVLDMNEASQVAGLANQAVANMDVGMSNLMAALAAAGISVRGMGGDLTGISRDIATASEESILGLAAGINTQNYYISQVPAKMDIIIGLLQGGGVTAQGSTVTLQDLVTLQNQHLSYLPTIAQHTADTVAECKAIVAETRRTADALERVIKPEGTKAAYKLNTTLS